MARERVLLWCGVVGGPLFVVVFLVNDRIREHYDPVRDFVSEAAIGPGGWLQIANFLVTGALAVAFAVAARRVVSRWAGWLIGVFGVGLMLAGVFVSDPAPHTTSTAHGTVHNLVSVVVFASLAAAAFVSARRWPSRRWRWYCRAVGVLVPVLFVLAGGVESATGIFQRLAIAIGFTWLAVLAWKSLHHVRDDDSHAEQRPSPPSQARPPAKKGRSAPIA